MEPMSALRKLASVTAVVEDSDSVTRHALTPEDSGSKIGVTEKAPSALERLGWEVLTDE
jgi:hypothetical protein